MVVERLFDFDVRLAMLQLGGFDERQALIEDVPKFRDGGWWAVVGHRVFCMYAAHEIDTGRL